MKIEETKPNTFKSLNAGVVLTELAVGLLVFAAIAGSIVIIAHIL